jgi:hypothetical protein
MVGCAPRLRMRISDGERKAHNAEERHIRYVIPDAGTGTCCDLGELAQPLKCRKLVARALHDARDAKLPATGGYGGRAPTGNDGDFDAGADQLTDAKAVARVKGFQGLAARPEVQPPIREHAVNVEYEETDGGGGNRLAHHFL